MTGGYDPAQHHTAAQLTARYPHWLIVWGTHTRRYWAYPRFTVPPGNLIHAPNPTELLTLMKHTEHATTGHPPRLPAEEGPR
jgi:hypothetical protein